MSPAPPPISKGVGALPQIQIPGSISIDISIAFPAASLVSFREFSSLSLFYDSVLTREYPPSVEFLFIERSERKTVSASVL